MIVYNELNDTNKIFLRCNNLIFILIIWRVLFRNLYRSSNLFSLKYLRILFNSTLTVDFKSCNFFLIIILVLLAN